MPLKVWAIFLSARLGRASLPGCKKKGVVMTGNIMRPSFFVLAIITLGLSLGSASAALAADAPKSKPLLHCTSYDARCKEQFSSKLIKLGVTGRELSQVLKSADIRAAQLQRMIAAGGGTAGDDAAQETWGCLGSSWAMCFGSDGIGFYWPDLIGRPSPLILRCPPFCLSPATASESVDTHNPTSNATKREEVRVSVECKSMDDACLSSLKAQIQRNPKLARHADMLLREVRTAFESAGGEKGVRGRNIKDSKFGEDPMYPSGHIHFSWGDVLSVVLFVLA